MSPIVLIVFAPVIVFALAFMALLLGAASAGIWEVAEESVHGDPSAPASARSPAAPQQEAYTRAA
jgi:hypothetical protein